MGKLQVGLIFIDGLPEFNIGALTELRLRGVWNPEVTNIVYASNGTQLKLSDEAVAQLKQQYDDGKPMYVTFQVKTKCCAPGQCASCGCDFSQGFDCVPRVIVPLGADTVWFGKRDKVAKISGALAFIANTFCCAGACNQCPCCLKQVQVDAAQVEIGPAYGDLFKASAAAAGPETQSMMGTGSAQVAPAPQ